MQTNTSAPNKLINEKSPYLLQHAYNPVDWHPWSEESFEIARKEDKPIFLSIGYSTCYWCHVMEREVFENAGIAGLMNEYFVNIKVDREERPDVDRVYMTVLQAITGGGGWPMSLFLTPGLKPFYAATYIPPKSKYGRAGFEDVIEEIHKIWLNKKDEVLQSGDKIVSAINARLGEVNDSSEEITLSLFSNALTKFENAYDPENGGFGSGNKFPRPPGLDFLLNIYQCNKEFPALDMTLHTLKKMYEGGTFDHLGKGFHRYSVDMYWRVPHFEKMLYDQAQLVTVYTNAYKITKNIFFLSVAEKTAEYMMTNLFSPDGAFYSAEDAESAVSSDEPRKKEEGAYYLWLKQEIDEALGAEVSRIYCYHYGIEAHGNTIHDPHEVFGKKNVLYISHDLFDTAKKFGMTHEETAGLISMSNSKLLSIRSKRPAPSLDDKILTSWNSLAISGLCTLYGATGKDEYINIAEKAAQFILANLTTGKDGDHLLHRYKDGEARFSGTLEDYVFFIEALIKLYESTFKADYLTLALKFNGTVLGTFYDSENGGFYDAGPDETDLILRTKETYDGAEPSGNAVQIMNLLKLSAMTGNPDFSGIADRSLKLFAADLRTMPFSSPAMLNAVRFLAESPQEIIVSGDAKSGRAKELADHIRSLYLPNSVLLCADGETEKLFPFLAKITGSKSENVVYVCRNRACSLPAGDIQKIDALLIG